jgi:hypothetical protein
MNDEIWNLKALQLIQRKIHKMKTFSELFFWIDENINFAKIPNFESYKFWFKCKK